MATVTGTIVLPDGNPYAGKIKFHRLDAPAAVGPALVTGIFDGLTIETSPTGEFTTFLKAGSYKLQIAGAQAWKIHLLHDDASYDIADLGVPGFPAYGVAGGGGGSAAETEFPTVGAMLASDTSLWSEAWCQNYATGDGTKTEWQKTIETLTPNGSDILESNDGAILVRKFIRFES